MSAREELRESLLPVDRYPAPGEAEDVDRLLDAYRAEVERELIRRMRGQLAAGLKMPGYARVVVEGGSYEPLSTTHILDAWDPDRGGTMRPAAVALEELRGWPAP